MVIKALILISAVLIWIEHRWKKQEEERIVDNLETLYEMAPRDIFEISAK
ncbi:hypothetical protein CPT_Mendera_102 [Stenotrophomonas phage Mendera]|uniref:Uncharacterized protein n=2 Tax=Menderavirus TaxID=2843421 RepID=A0A5P8PM81_9CAUD|nr:hypothetical protein HWC58_gp100 [Stenotrophomonas phage Moby]YP_009851159.1 hypothetical protein HWC60_gp102 [Stenotrophomonas phage Mendera]QXN67472.1 hypothetical protein [Stenotrophomonas phage BUCT608]QFR56651.1 hypothetical protein CPT_Mendera_102 [Stenotrophomonas phage Mendera]QFR57848.1 hypothetical protein CPT_Moby_100 [Stenotrophomonas phage Moby]QYC97610.1 hypothetical protein [Stenotrophomonas phage BUCT608]